jgi:hypothetical protein
MTVILDAETRVPNLTSVHVGTLARHLQSSHEDKLLQFITGSLEILARIDHYRVTVA